MQRIQPASRHSTCPYCGVGCGILASHEPALRINGDPTHPANQGRLCSKGAALAQTVRQDGRLLHPQIHGVRASWSQATDFIARQFRQIIAQHGPDAIAFYLSGQLLTEDYYIANKLMKGFIGSANIDTNSRLCMSSAVSGHKRAFGEDAVPGCYEDLELADLIVLVGANTAWCHPVLFQRIKAAKARNPALKIVVIDPRATATCEIADLHLPLKPGSDVRLFNGLLVYLAERQALDQDYIARHTNGFDSALAQARQDAPDLASVARACDLDSTALAHFYHWFADTARILTCFSQGVNQSSRGSDKVNAIFNCHLATGRVGKPGASPLSLTGQPNAMGGREVGGLANQLAAHHEFTPSALDRVQRFWQAPNLVSRPGLPVVDMFRAVEQGRIKAIWIMGTNPVVSMPDADQIKRALQQCPLVILSDCIAATDTSAFAHVLLPATGWSEKDGTVTNSERRISRQRALLDSSGEARHDWHILRDLAHALGHGAQFPYQCAAEIFREHAALSAFENDPATTSEQEYRRLFNLAGLQHLSNADYDNLQPLQWPVPTPGQGTARLYGDGQFSTPDGRARFVPVQWQAPVHQPTAEWPLVLNTGRIRDQWHTMTRTALAAVLNQHQPEPFVEIHPDTARAHQIGEGHFVRIRSPWGSMLAKAQLRPELRSGDIFVPIHWNDQHARHGRVGALTSPATDPVSHQPETKHSPCRIERWQPCWTGFLLTQTERPLPDSTWACKIRGEGFFRYELAGDDPLSDWPALARQLGLPAEPELFYVDKANSSYRMASLKNDALELCLFVSTGEPASLRHADRQWISTLFGKTALEPLERKALLSGKSPAGVEDCGRTICACHGVGEKTIRKAIVQQQLKTLADLGNHLKAGTGCGSCVAELKTLLAG